MSKNPLKKIIINKRNPPKNLDNKKSSLKSFQLNDNNNKYIINEKPIKNHIIHNRNSKKNILSYNLENKENYSFQNSKTKENNTINIQDLNYYLIKPNQKNVNISDYENKPYEKMNNIKYVNKHDNIKYIESKYSKKNSVYSKLNNTIANTIINKDNNSKSNYEINKNYKKLLINDTNIRKNNEHFLTSRIEENSTRLNQQNTNINKMKNQKTLDNYNVTERDNNKNSNLYFKNNFFLPENTSGKKTLILDLDETLIHSSLKPFNIKDEITLQINPPQKNNENYIIYVLKRPYVNIFLSIVCDIFEVVIFTASISDYANPILDLIDTEKKIKYRLYREHCIKIDKDKYVKNLYCLGRDLKDVIIIDNNPVSYALNVENGIPISTWQSNQADNELIKLIPFLQFLSQNIVSDVRGIIKKVVNNNSINYNEINKLIIPSKSNMSKKNNSENKIKVVYKNDKKIFDPLYQKLELNDIKLNQLNDSIYNSKKLLNNIFINKEHEFFINKLKAINKANHRGKSTNQKTINFIDYPEYEPKNNTLGRKNYNLPERYNIIKTGRNECDSQKSLKTEISHNINMNIIKNKARINKTYIEKYKKDITIPRNQSFIIPIYKKNLKNKNKIISKFQNRIYFIRDDSNKELKKNYSDYSRNITKSLEKDKNEKYRRIIKYPTLKNIFYNNIFPKTPENLINNHKFNRNISSDSYRTLIYNNNSNNSILDESKYKKQNIINMKRYDYNIKENEKKKNLSVVNYLNNKCNLTVLDGKMNNYIIKLDNQNIKIPITNTNNNYLKIDDKFTKENHSLILSKYINNYSENNRPLNVKRIDNSSIIKHSFSFLNDNKNKNDYSNIIKGGYKKSTFN